MWQKKLLIIPKERLDRTIFPTPQQLFAKLGYIQHIAFLYSHSANASQSGNRPFLSWDLANLFLMPECQLQELSADTAGINAFMNDSFAFVHQGMFRPS